MHLGLCVCDRAAEYKKESKIFVREAINEKKEGEQT